MPFPSALRFLVISLTACHLAQSEATEIEIGGPRHVQASIEKTGDCATCLIRFVPVSCFDKTTNHSINLTKSKLYAYQALSKLVGTKTGDSLEAFCHPLKAPQFRDGICAASYRFEGIKVMDNPPPAAHQPGGDHDDKTKAPSIKGADADRAKGDLLSCADDMRDTIDTLSKVFDSRLENLGNLTSLEDAVADMETEFSAAFAKLVDEIQSQKLLLGTEKAELLSYVEERKTALVEKLKRKYHDLAPEKD